MKRSTILIGVGLALSVMQGCYKDTGNYDYTDINEAVISDSASLELITVIEGDTLKLYPQIDQSLYGTDTSKLTYQWVTYENSAGASYVQEKTVIATTRNLEYQVLGTPYVVSRYYRLNFIATDKETGVSYTLPYDLYISSDFPQGWVIMEDVNSQTDLSLIKQDGTIFHNFYSSRSGYTPLGSPVEIDLIPISVTDALSDPGYRLYLLGETNAVELDYTTMEKKFNYSELFYNPPAIPHPQHINWGAYQSGTRVYTASGMIIDDGKAHFNLTGGFPGEKKWGAVLLNPNGSSNYQLFPYMAGTKAYSSTLQKTVYDNKDKRFYSAESSALKAFPDSRSDLGIFDMNNVGLTMLNMDSANVFGEWQCVMKDDAGQAFYLRFTADANPVATLSKMQISDLSILDATSYTSSTITPHIYYDKGNSIMKFETTSGFTSSIYSFDAGEQITSLLYKKAVPGESGSWLIAATWNGSQGKLYMLPVNSVGDVSAPAKTFTGFAKIVDIAYKSL